MSRQVSEASPTDGGREDERGMRRSTTMSPSVAAAAERAAARRAQMAQAFTTPDEIPSAVPEAVTQEVTPTVTQASPPDGGIDFRGVPVDTGDLPVRAMGDGKDHTMEPMGDNMEMVDGISIAEGLGR